MQHSRHLPLWLALAAAIVFTCAAVAVLAIVAVPSLVSWAYTTTQLRTGRAEVYPSAEEGMRTIIARSYVQPDEVEIVYAGTNSFDGSDPHVWYVIACVWGGRRADGSPVGSSRHPYDQPGTFFLDTKQGWVQVPESVFPGRVGRWLKVYDLAGPGSAQPSHKFRDPPRARCADSSGW